MPEGSRKWASLSFYRGRGAAGGLPLWERRTGRNPGTQINTYSGRHTQFIGHATLNEDGGGVTASTPGSLIMSAL